MSGLLVLAPLRLERAALPGLAARVTGMGARTAETAGADAVVIAGFCGAVDRRLRAGDIVLATELRSAEGRRGCPGSSLLVTPLRRLGLRVRTGPLYSAGRILGPADRAALIREGVIAVDMESYWLAGAAATRPLAVLRVVVDEGGRRLLDPRTLPAGLRAFRALRRAATALPGWAEAALSPWERTSSAADSRTPRRRNVDSREINTSRSRPI
jgi:4-hydroxy-3-methylbut-2-enyl diphosphate reductase